MTRVRALAVAVALAAALPACGDRQDEPDGTDADSGFVARELRTLHACVYLYFGPWPDIGYLGTPEPRWTIGVMDHPEIGTGVTNEGGCTDIELPAPSDLLVTASKPGWVPVAMTTRVRDEDMLPMQARFAEGLPALEPWWWQVTQGNVASDEPTGIVVVEICDRSTSLDSGGCELITDIHPQLITASGEVRENWLYVEQYATSYCNLPDNMFPCPPTGIGGTSRVPPGIATIVLPGVTCPIGPDESALAWPDDGTTNRFTVDVRPGYLTGLVARCEREGP